MNQCVLPVAEEYGFVADGSTEQTEFGLRLPLAKIGPSRFSARASKTGPLNCSSTSDPLLF
jgi:hypothetical protein